MIKKLYHFIYNITSNHVPIQLYNSFILYNHNDKNYNLRSKTMFNPQFTRTTQGEHTFSYFLTKFINLILHDDIYIEKKFFNLRVMNNDNLFLKKLEKEFPKFDLKL